MATSSRPNPDLYYNPVIGILSHPGDGTDSRRLCNNPKVSNIPASYVKFVESGGARVIPLIYDESPEDRKKKLDLVNGVIFTGGADSPQYFRTVQSVFKYAKERNKDRDATGAKKDRDHFPVYGIDLGFRHLARIVSEDDRVLEDFDASNRSSNLQFLGNTNIEGTVFQRFAPDLLEKLKTDRLVMHNHHHGISPTKFQNTPKLANFFEILTTSRDAKGKFFVSTARARNYPVTIFQWHPEKNAFEWASSGKQPHTEDAIRVTQSAANFLVSEARKSRNRPDAQIVLDNLIYNHRPTYCGRAGTGYDQVYLFE